jgi:hypothetical protein
MVSRISGGSCSQGPWKEEIYRQCLFGRYFIALANQSKINNSSTYLLRHMTSVGVEGSETVVCGAIGGEVGPLGGAVLGLGLECPLDRSSTATSATEALEAFFLAIAVPGICVFRKGGMMVLQAFPGMPCGWRLERNVFWVFTAHVYKCGSKGAGHHISGE